MSRYEVTVDDMGVVYSGQLEHVARRMFRDYVNRSDAFEGAAVGKTVTMTCDGEIKRQRKWGLRVVLTAEEIAYVTAVGVARQDCHVRASRSDQKTAKTSGELIHIQGATAEFVISKAFGIGWDGKFFDNERWLEWRKTGRDVGPLEVRATAFSEGNLILHPYDPDDAPFLLVLLHANPVFDISGWILAKDGKRKEWWRDNLDRPCYFVSPTNLRPVSELVKVLRNDGRF